MSWWPENKVEGTADVRTGDWPCQKCGILCFDWSYACYKCRILKGNEGEYYNDETFRHINSVSGPVSMALSSSHPNSGGSSPQPQYRSPLPVGSSPPQQYPLQQPLPPAQAPTQPAPEASRTDISGLEEEVRNCKMDLQKIGKVVERLESELKKLKRQRDFSSAVQGLRETLDGAEVLKIWNNLAKDQDSEEQE